MKTYALFAIDPGTTSGIAHFDSPIRLDGSLAGIFKTNSWTVLQMESLIADDGTNEHEGAVAIADYFLNLFYGAYQGADNVIFVYEDFILRPGKQHNPERAGLSPVRVMAHIQGYLTGHAITYRQQQPSAAKTTFTNDRLRRNGLWTVGKEHGRDATRHLALAVRALRDGR